MAIEPSRYPIPSDMATPPRPHRTPVQGVLSRKATTVNAIAVKIGPITPRSPQVTSDTPLFLDGAAEVGWSGAIVS